MIKDIYVNGNAFSKMTVEQIEKEKLEKKLEKLEDQIEKKKDKTNAEEEKCEDKKEGRAEKVEVENEKLNELKLMEFVSKKGFAKLEAKKDEAFLKC